MYSTDKFYLLWLGTEGLERLDIIAALSLSTEQNYSTIRFVSKQNMKILRNIAF